MRYGKMFHELKVSEMSHSCETGVVCYFSYTLEMRTCSRALYNCEISQNISSCAYGKLLQEVYQV